MNCFHVNVRCKFILFITDHVIVESGLLWNMELSNPSACSNDSTCSYLSVSRTHPLIIAELVRYYHRKKFKISILGNCNGNEHIPIVISSNGIVEQFPEWEFLYFHDVYCRISMVEIDTQIHEW